MGGLNIQEKGGERAAYNVISHTRAMSSMCVHIHMNVLVGRTIRQSFAQPTLPSGQVCGHLRALQTSSTIGKGMWDRNASASHHTCVPLLSMCLSRNPSSTTTPPPPPAPSGPRPLLTSRTSTRRSVAAHRPSASLSGSCCVGQTLATDDPC